MSNRRRSERIEACLPVVIKAGQDPEKTMTADVSMHGLAVFSQTKIPLKQFVELAIKLPDNLGTAGRDVKVTAQVVRSMNLLEDGGDFDHPGLCFDFHAFHGEGHKLWRRYIQNKQGLSPSPPGGWRPDDSARAEEVMAFIVRPVDVPRLWAFYEMEFGRGRSKVESPEALPNNTLVELVLIHPETEAEWIFEALVLSNKSPTTKNTVILELGLSDVSADAKEAFRVFIRTGFAATRPARPPSKRSSPPPPPVKAKTKKKQEPVEQAGSEAPTPPAPQQRRPTFASFFDEYRDSVVTESNDEPS